MRIGIQCNSDVAVSLQVLEYLVVHLRHVATAGIAAEVMSNIRHLYTVNVIIRLDYVVGSVFTIHSQFRVFVFYTFLFCL